MTISGLMHASKHRIHDAKWRSTHNASPRNSVTRPHAAVGIRCRLERADDRRSDSDDAPVFRLRTVDSYRGMLMNSIGLVKGEAHVERGISGRRNTGGVRERSKAYATLPPDFPGAASRAQIRPRAARMRSGRRQFSSRHPVRPAARAGARIGSAVRVAQARRRRLRDHPRTAVARGGDGRADTRRSQQVDRA